MLDLSEIAPYLLRRGLVTPQSVADENLTIYDLSRRNHNVAAVSDRGKSYFLKQATSPARVLSVANEARVYGQFHAESSRNRDALRYLPEYVAYDQRDHILILEFFPDALNLYEHHARYGRFSRKLGSSLGRALSAIHGMDVSSLKQDTTASHNPPWIFLLHRPGLEDLCDLSEASVRMVEIVQRNDRFCDLLGELLQDWRRDTFIHSDIKWENCLYLQSGRKPGVKLIDWELAGLGDPMWDVGSVFSAYLSFWLLNVPPWSGVLTDALVQSARYPLVKIQPALRAFWSAYLQGRKVDSQLSRLMLIRAVRNGAARLAQMAIEQTQAATKLTSNAVYLLQLCLNALERPERAASVLLGIPAGSDGNS